MKPAEDRTPHSLETTRRELLAGSAAAIALTALPYPALAQQTGTLSGVSADMRRSRVSVSMTDAIREIEFDNRTTLLDALRETIRLTATKKGCDHG